MCGIAGIIAPSKSLDTNLVLQSMLSTLAHRGPDSQGLETWQRGNWSVGLGHTRLAVIDLSPAGRQPMRARQCSTWITYNGEIYNFKQLRDTLNNKDEHWQSQTDTEVILRGYNEWGPDVLNLLRGMFALAVWDADKRVLFIARDPFGLKPLYYYQNGATFIFASEIRSILETGLLQRQLCPESVVSYLLEGSAQAPLTLVNGIRSVLPGYCVAVELKEDELESREFSYSVDLFSPAPLFSDCGDYREATVRLRELLEESVRLHLVSDVPLGFFLSGGIDSSALVGLMSRVSDERPKTFSIVFGESEFSEVTYSRLVAKRYRTDHHEIYLSEEELQNTLPHALKAMDHPTIDGINTYVISKAVKAAGVTVALSGLGGDELFAGYPSFRRALRLRQLRRIPSYLRRVAAALGKHVFHHSVRQWKAWELLRSDGNPLSAYLISRQLFSLSEIGTLLGLNNDQSWSPEAAYENYGDVVNAVSVCELRGYMANTLLRDTDVMSMAHALEVRVPFVDSVIVPYVLGLPGKWKVNDRRPKPLLLDALGDLLPQEIWQRPKMGFTLPFERWTQSLLASDIEEHLGCESGLKRLGFDPRAVHQVWESFRQNPKGIGWSRPWSLYVLAKWCELYSFNL